MKRHREEVPGSKRSPTSCPLADLHTDPVRTAITLQLGLLPSPSLFSRAYVPFGGGHDRTDKCADRYVDYSCVRYVDRVGDVLRGPGPELSQADEHDR